MEEVAAAKGISNGVNVVGLFEVIYLLPVLDGCLTKATMYHEAARGHKITSAESTLEVNLALHGFLGVDEKVRSGYNRIKATMKVDDDCSESQVQEMIQVAQARFPVSDTVTNPVPVQVVK